MIYYVSILTLFISLIIVFIFLFLLINIKDIKPATEVISTIYKIRTKYIYFLLFVIFVSLFFVFNNTPYYKSEKKPDQIISVIAKKWLWQLRNGNFKNDYLFSSETENIEISKNKIIEFQVTSDDVNHGFGIYNEKGYLIGQVQAMPNYVNNLLMSFSEPGVYQILCMEYCGIGHHIMQTFFKVK